MSGAAARLALFCRAPRPKRTKTRLAPGLGAAGAAAFSAALLLDLIEGLAGVDADLELWVAGERDRAAVAALAGELPVRVQDSGDLGARMLACFVDAAAADRPANVIAGSDCPGLTPSVVAGVLTALADADAAICPGGDGGYGLIAARRPLPALFTGMDWGTDRVCAQTRAAAAAAGLSLAEPCTADDVDRPEDIVALRRELRRGSGSTPLGRTRALLSVVDGRAQPR